MAAPTADELAAVEARLRAILVPYEDRLETASIYSIPTLRRAGAKAHDWFAFVKASPGHIGFYLLPIYSHPGLREGLSPALAKRLTGKSSFTFKALDEALATELEGLVARAYDAYMGSAAGGAVADAGDGDTHPPASTRTDRASAPEDHGRRHNRDRRVPPARREARSSCASRG